VSLYFGKLWDVVFWVLTFILFCWKGNKLPYADEVFEYEFSFLFLWLLTEPTRLFLGSKGNKTLTTKPLLFSLTLAGFSLFLHVYYIVAQAFVLRADLVMNSISMAFLGA
jgi:transmembrane protein 216